MEFIAEIMIPYEQINEKVVSDGLNGKIGDRFFAKSHCKYSGIFMILSKCKQIRKRMSNFWEEKPTRIRIIIQREVSRSYEYQR